MQRRGHLLVIVTALALGALVNVAVAWRYALFDGYFLQINQIRTRGSYPVTPPPGYAASPLVESASTTGTTTIECVPPLWQFRFGWPMRSLAWSTTTTPTQTAATGITRIIQTRRSDGSIQIVPSPPAALVPAAPELGLLFEGLQIPSGATAWIQRRLSPAFQPGSRRLPIHPLPLGFAVNTAVYALPFFGIGMMAWWLIIKRQRRKLGLCERCAYSLVGLAPETPCPECGTVRLPKQ